GTGRLVVAEALRRGHAVKALVRGNQADIGGAEGFADSVLASPAEVVRGDIRDRDAVPTALAGGDAGISCLGARLGQPPGTVRSDGTRTLVAAMRQAGPRRLVVVSTVGVGSSRARQSRPARLLWPRIVGTDRLVEADRAEREVIASDLEWTIVRPPRLVDAPAPGRIEVRPELRTRLSTQVSRLDLARLLVDLVEGSRFLREAVTVAGRR